jgi:hypothetical protein
LKIKKPLHFFLLAMGQNPVSRPSQAPQASPRAAHLPA